MQRGDPRAQTGGSNLESRPEGPDLPREFGFGTQNIEVREGSAGRKPDEMDHATRIRVSPVARITDRVADGAAADPRDVRVANARLEKLGAIEGEEIEQVVTRALRVAAMAGIDIAVSPSPGTMVAV